MKNDWMVSISLKIVLVLFLPLSVTISTEGVGYACALFNSQGSLYYIVPDRYSPLITVPFSLIYLLPGIIFNYLLSHRPDDTSFTKLIGASFILMNPFVEVFTIMPLLSIFSFDAYYSIQMHAVVAIMTCRWGLPLFVIIPYLQREIGKLHETSIDSSVSGFSLIGELRDMNRYDLSVFVLGALACFAPKIISLASYGYPSYSQQVIMLSGVLVYQFTLQTSLSYELFSVSEMYYPLAPIATAISMYYAYSIIKYLQNRTSKIYCLVTGIMSVVAPLLLLSFLGFYPFAEITTIYPLPLTFFVGLAILIFLEPREITSRDDFLSKSAWYKDESMPKADESVKVPISHIVRSKIRKSREFQPVYDWDHGTEDVFDEDE